MKLIKTSQQFLSQRLHNLIENSARVGAAFSLGLAVALCLLIWFGGPHLAWDDYAPFINMHKRIYVISAIMLVWLIKYLVIDLDTPNPNQYKDPLLIKQLLKLQKKVRGALSFLKKTTLSRRGKVVKLNQLPWFLFIGPPHAGKTSLLAKSNVNFILQRQFQHQRINPSQASEHCDWWITREASIIDVPSRYLQVTPKSHQPVLWDYFLRLTKDQRGDNSVNGIMIALPLAELLNENDSKKTYATFKRIFNRIHELEKYYDNRIPCYIVVTKCDLLSGFKQYFAESGQDEASQAWGISLPTLENKNDLYEACSIRLNALIKKLNEQLLWRLHQERDPMARPYIKDFPLQVERLKDLILQFVKKYADESLKPFISGIYLTSALQNEPEEADPIEETISSTRKDLQLFKQPKSASQAYFIKQFLLQAIALPEEKVILKLSPALWKKYVSYAASLFVISIVAIVLGRDFDKGLKQTYAIKKDFSKYKLAISKFHNPVKQLNETTKLLNQLERSVAKSEKKAQLDNLLNYYSNQSVEKAHLVYNRALQDILLPEIKVLLQDDIENPINHETDDLYRALKAYVMLEKPKHIDMNFFINIVDKKIQATLTKEERANLLKHLTAGLKNMRSGLSLDQELVNKARYYLVSLKPLDLAFTILKNQPQDKDAQDIAVNPISLVNKSESNHQKIIPSIYTARAFDNTFSNNISKAANQAINGNWIIGSIKNADNTIDTPNQLIEKLRVHYINQYASTWESVLKNITTPKSKNLSDVDNVIKSMATSDSPIIALLTTLHENTYFEPIASASDKLLKLGRLLEKNEDSGDMLNKIQRSLTELHQYIEPVLTSDNRKKAAFNIVSTRMKAGDKPDAITQVRLLATQSPQPIKKWLEQITDDTWQYLMTSATRYIDLSWQDEVSSRYQESIMGRFPFKSKSEKEVSLASFIKFFGNPGVFTSFYKNYLQAFVDTSQPNWQWKKLDNRELPFSQDHLHQIQQAMRIHKAFFPKGNDIPSVNFTLEAHELANEIHKIKLAINDESFTDTSFSKHKHSVAWPNLSREKSGTTLQFTLNDKKVVSKEYPGDWGWFKLLNQSFESASSKKQIVVKFAQAGKTAKYLVITDDNFNPFMTMNLNHFNLPDKLSG